ncbi:HNH endonuclease signature motif containing protein [Bradyrhizobium roseum]|uniref:HNH endonuclease signature motif containing protein n=1 Tax=Bradyrhizobium roseum TaxID=3056648 RepID=UPI00260B7F01|nr:HNH endonuclease signature motif containing protein [Bradyrhizobium roseus]WKA29331.1 HNH endonuclease signature motif containing protein [Bradyrhizobium roseus]
MRTRIPDDVTTEVLYQHDRICCVCNEPGKAVQLHHIDEDPSNHDPDNLAVLCLQHHEETQISGGFGRKLRAVDVSRYREEWTRRIQERRIEVDRMVIARLAAIPGKLAPGTSREVEDASFRYRPSAKVLRFYLETLPDIIGDAYANGATMLIAEGDSRVAVAAGQLIVGVLEQILVQLSQWVDPYHFGGKPIRNHYSEFVALRNWWNRLLIESKDCGNQARAGTVETLEGTIADLRGAILSLVTALGTTYLDDFNAQKWAVRLARPTYYYTRDI